MCGLFGAIISNTTVQFDLGKISGFIHDAMLVGVLRGDYSTGYFKVQRSSMIKDKLTYIFKWIILRKSKKYYLKKVVS